MRSPFYSDVPIGAQGDLWRMVLERVAEASRLREALGPEHPRTLLAVARVAAALRRSGRLFDALGRHQEVVEGLRDLQWTPGFAATSDAGVTLAALGYLDDAARLQQQALTRLNDSAEALDPATVAATHNLALTLSALGRHDDALFLQKDLSSRLTDAYGSSHPDALTALGRHATALGMAGYLDEAHAAWQTTFELRRERFGATDPRALAALANIGETLRASGELDRAQGLQRYVVEQLASVVGEWHPSVLSAKEDLAITLTTLGDARPARALGEQVLSGRVRALGPEHPQTLAAMRTLGAALATSGEHQRAAALARRALRRSAHVLGEDHPDTVAARRDLSIALEEAGSAGAGGEAGTLKSASLPEPGLAARMTAQDEFVEGNLTQPPADLAAAEPRGAVVTRMPHLEIDSDGPLRPGASFAVRVYANVAARPGEDSTPMQIELPSELAAVSVTVWLVTSRHFEVHDESLAQLSIDWREETTDELTFALSVLESLDDLEEEEPFVMAVFSYNGRPSGRVRRVLEIETPVHA